MVPVGEAEGAAQQLDRDDHPDREGTRHERVLDHALTSLVAQQPRGNFAHLEP
ncbi:hypothetical protein D3C87_2081910 [compost metagenome]